YLSTSRASTSEDSCDHECHTGVYRFCHGSVDTPIDGVNTRSESLMVFHEDRVKCVDTAPGSVDTSPRFQKTQLPDWDSVSTQPVNRVKCVDTAPGRVDTSPRFQKTQLPDWDSVSTQQIPRKTRAKSLLEEGKKSGKEASTSRGAEQCRQGKKKEKKRRSS
ncbi:hypothetical protein Taro_033910, partial [Colocasia esculenta]|nr:hypothetical protein [Colocasia esculenta]